MFHVEHIVTTLIPILGDQLSHDLASLRGVGPTEAVVLMAEVMEEASYVPHHKQKLVLVFSAMRHFAEDLRGLGWTVDYVRLDNPANQGSLTGELVRAARQHGAGRIRAVEAGEYRVCQLQAEWHDRTGLPVDILPDDRFYVSRRAFGQWAAKRTQLRMEDFYRTLRRREDILMEGDEPSGGAWNYDKDNRKRAPAGMIFREPPRFPVDAITADVKAMVEARFPDNFGTLDGFEWPVTRADALVALKHFVRHRLPAFGDYQDAMVDGEEVLNHSLLAPAMNLGLLSPREVVEAAVAAWRAGAAPLNCVEGFVRQILGWREYVRGVYFHFGPDYTTRNALAATRPLPGFYWTADSGMRCLDKAVEQTRDRAYAHHIQRLMVLGNFALLAGIDPQEVQRWFLLVYADAFEWVEAPNVSGMALFADGGLMASKPYAAGGAYINRMSDHCRMCRYDVRQRSGPEACPFNYLYWDFLGRHEEKLAGNHRLRTVYDGWRRLGEARQAEVRADAAQFLTALT